MRRAAGVVAILLLLITAAPVLACVTDSAMTPEERACCRSMHGECGEMPKTGCESYPDFHPQLAASSSNLDLAVLVVMSMVSQFTWAPTLDLPLSRFPDGHPPPGLLLAKTAVLRSDRSLRPSTCAWEVRLRFHWCKTGRSHESNSVFCQHIRADKRGVCR